MISRMNLFNAQKNESHNVSDRDIEDFIFEFRYTFSVDSDKYRELWEGDRSYWFAYMLQLAFNSGSIVRALSSCGYLYQAVSGSKFSCMGQALGYITKPVDGIPEFYSHLSPREFIKRFLGTDGQIQQDLQQAFGGMYAWYFANFIDHCTGVGHVRVIIDNGNPVPVCDTLCGMCYTVYGMFDASSNVRIEMSAFGTAINYFKALPNTGTEVSEVVRQVVAQRLGSATGESSKEEVLAFILRFRGNTYEQVSVVESLFGVDYTWHFAMMLKNVFQRGSIHMLDPYERFVWVDVDGTAYSIRGACDISGANMISWEQVGEKQEKYIHPEHN